MQISVIRIARKSRDQKTFSSISCPVGKKVSPRKNVSIKQGVGDTTYFSMIKQNLVKTGNFMSKNIGVTAKLLGNFDVARERSRVLTEFSGFIVKFNRLATTYWKVMELIETDSK